MVRVLGWVRREVDLAESVRVTRDLVGADRMHVDRCVQRWRVGRDDRSCAMVCAWRSVLAPPASHAVTSAGSDVDTAKPGSPDSEAATASSTDTSSGRQTPSAHGRPLRVASARVNMTSRSPASSYNGVRSAQSAMRIDGSSRPAQTPIGCQTVLVSRNAVSRRCPGRRTSRARRRGAQDPLEVLGGRHLELGRELGVADRPVRSIALTSMCEASHGADLGCVAGEHVDHAAGHVGGRQHLRRA